MSSFDIIPLVDCLRQLTVQELEPLRTQGLLLPDLREIITTGERVYESNLRAILRYLKHVNKACKRQDPDSCCKVLAYRGVIQKLHDVDEWATKILLSLDLLESLNGFAEKAFTPDELREFLNASTASSSACNDNASPFTDDEEVFSSVSNITATTEPVMIEEDSAVQEGDQIRPKGAELSTTNTPENPVQDGIAFKFDGICRENTCETSPDFHHFRSRRASDPTSDKVENNTKSEYSFATQQVFGYIAESMPAPRRVSAPVSTQDASAQCFLQLTGETLDQFIAGVEVEETMIENKKRWLLQLHLLKSSRFLSRWPSPLQLQEFMRMHNLDWVVRVSGKWDVSPRSFEVREAIKNEAIDKLFSADVIESPAALIEDEVEVKIENDDSSYSSIEDATIFEDPATVLIPESQASQEVIEDNIAKDFPKGPPLEETSANRKINGNVNEPCVWKTIDCSAQVPCENILVEQDVADEHIPDAVAANKANTDEAASIRKESGMLTGLDASEEADKHEEVKVLGDFDVSEAEDTPAGVDIQQGLCVSKEIYVLAEVDMPDEFPAPQETHAVEELKCHRAYEHLKHIFVWLESGEFTQDSDAQEEVVLENREPKDLDIAVMVEYGEDDDSQHGQAEEEAFEETAVSNLGDACSSADIQGCNLAVQCREVATEAAKPVEDEQLPAAEVAFAKFGHEIDCDTTEAEAVPTIQLTIDDTDEAELLDEYEYDTTEADKVGGDQTFFVYDSDDYVTPFNDVDNWGSVEETEISRKVVTPKECLVICDMGNKSEVQEDQPVKIPSIFLILPDGSEVDVETQPWNRPKRANRSVYDPAKLAPPQSPKKASKRPMAQCSLPCCERCTKLPLKESEGKSEEREEKNNTEKSTDRIDKVAELKTLAETEKSIEEKSLKKSKGNAEKEFDTKSQTNPENESQDQLFAEGKLEKMSTPQSEMEAKDKLSVKHGNDPERAAVEVTEDSVALPITPLPANVDKTSKPAVEPSPTGLGVSATDNVASTYTPPKWSATPILVGVAASALYISARCSLAPALAIVLGSITLKTKLRQ